MKLNAAILVPSSAKLNTTRILVTTKLNERQVPVLRSCILIWSFLAIEVKEQDLIETLSILRIKTQEQRQWHDSGVFIVHWEHISHFVLIAGSHSKWAATHLPFCKICSLED